MITNTSTPPVRVSVLHAAPGRLRLRVMGLYRSTAMAGHIQRRLSAAMQIHGLQINPLTGNVLLRFSPSVPAESVLASLCQAVESAVPPLPERRRRASAQPQNERLASSGPAGRHKALLRGPHAPLPVPAPARPEGLRTAWHALPLEELMRRLECGDRGLESGEAQARLARYGANLLEARRSRSPLAMFLGQFNSPPVFLLGVSAVVSAATGGVADAAVVAGVVLINAIIGFTTENAAEHTIRALSEIGPRHARVLRDGSTTTVPVESVVPGDVLELAPGDFVAADARILSGSQLSVDESALTGESLPQKKRAEYVCGAETALGDRSNMVHMGTVVTGGSGRALVVATGAATEIGLIQALVGETRPPETPLQRQLDRMGTQLALLSGGICAGMFAMGMARGFGMLQMLKSAISLAVAAVPEGLPTVATTTLALGIQDMKRRKVLVRQLPAVETLGSVQVICLDKTGTLTLNKMSCVQIRTPDQEIRIADGRFWMDGETIEPAHNPALMRLLRIVSLCSESRLDPAPQGPQLNGSPTENALIEAALLAGIDVLALRRGLPTRQMQHRAENRPWMATLHAGTPEGLLLAIKGSPSEVLELCAWRMGPEGPIPLDETTRAQIRRQNEQMAGEALRVLGTAYALGAEPSLERPDAVWVGLIGMEDAMRPGMDRLMAQFHSAGIETVMITGDQSATAYSIGKRLHLNRDGPLEAIDSTSLDKLEPEILAGLVRHTAIFSRVSPAHKLKIVQALQRNGLVVAMTGDGINDGPALKAADIGVAMGSRGTDVARAVAGVVLQDDNLHTMVEAIRQGRSIYGNIRKSLFFLLSTNLSEIEVMMAGTAMGAPDILNPMQLLWINLVTDIFPGLGLALEPPERDVLRHPPRDPAESIIRGRDFLKLTGQSLLISAGTLGVYLLSQQRFGPVRANTNAFMTLTLAQLLHAYSCRSESTSVFRPGGRGFNPYLAVALGGTLIMQLAAFALPPLRALLSLSPPSAADLGLIVSGASAPFLINEAFKFLHTEPIVGTEPVPTSPAGEFAVQPSLESVLREPVP